MTLTRLEPTQLPPLSTFLDTVCPGLPFLDDNVHFALHDSLDSHVNDIDKLTWPLTNTPVAHVQTQAVLDRSYLNVSRPPFEHDVRKNIETTTYVPVPFHVARAFTQTCSAHDAAHHNGGLHIAANVNPLMQDPFPLVHSGCVSVVVEMRSTRRMMGDNRSPFNKVTNLINKLLRMGSEPRETHFYLVLDSDVAGRKRRPFAKVLAYDAAKYAAHGRGRLLVACNVNVVNVFALDDNYDYACTERATSTTAVFPLGEDVTAASSNSTSSTTGTTSGSCGTTGTGTTGTTTSCKPYTKVMEVPLVRLQLRTRAIVTCLHALADGVVLGLNTGELVMVNLVDLTCRVFDEFAQEDASAAVTALTSFHHSAYGTLLIAGFANGEVVVVDPVGAPHLYTKTVEGADMFATYFRKFDLSPLHVCKIDNCVIGHFKISHKAVTALATTMSHDGTHPHSPQVVAVAAEDGLVRFVDLINTHGCNYGDPTNFYNQQVVLDIVLNYFQDGIRSVAFSPDSRFFSMAGKGDLIEVFRMTYYNINGLLLKNDGARNRSRSATVNSTGSVPFAQSFLLPVSTTPATSLDIPRDDHEYYPPAIKDIAIVTRLKGHTNTVEHVSFLRNEDLVLVSMDTPPSRTYKLISCGSDGKVIVWNFDSKVLPRVKKSHITTRRVSVHPEQVSSLLPLPAPHRKPIPTISMSHHRKRSITQQTEDMTITSSFSGMGISRLLSDSPQPLAFLDFGEEHVKIVLLLYRSLFEVRMKKHYNKSKDRKRCTSLVHAVVDDKMLPLIDTPLLSIDMLCLIRDGKIQGFHVNPVSFWVFARSGDIFRYSLITSTSLEYLK